jgi:glycosyltransferase 2 family protein
MKKKRNLVYTFLKITITTILLYVVFSNIQFSEVWSILKIAKPAFLLLALICFVLSQLISANRLLNLFRWSGYMLSSKSNYTLYLIGMFYNFFIPGGIGGDAYKIYILNKEFKWSLKKLTSIIFIDRLMGLIAIGILINLLCFFVPYFSDENLIWILFLTLFVGLVSSFFFLKYLFPSFLGIYAQSLLLSIIIQILQCTCIVLFLISINETDEYIIYIISFLISSVLSIFSFSGIGIREMVFYQASNLFAFDSMKSVTIGLLFSVLTALVSLFGIYFHFNKSNNRFIKKLKSNF